MSFSVLLAKHFKRSASTASLTTTTKQTKYEASSARHAIFISHLPATPHKRQNLDGSTLIKRRAFTLIQEGGRNFATRGLNELLLSETTFAEPKAFRPTRFSSCVRKLSKRCDVDAPVTLDHDLRLLLISASVNLAVET